MSRALILTVGTGTRPDTDIVKPLVLTLRSSNPERVVFLVSDLSRPNAELIQKQCQLAEDAVEFVRLSDHDDIDRVYEEALGALQRLQDFGYLPEDIDADFTSGTKAMSAGLVLAAVDFGCNALKYVSGRREHGVVVAGTEKVSITQPAVAWAHRDLAVAIHALRLLQYRAARDVCQRLTLTVLSERDRRLADSIIALADAYEAWDKFQHSGFMGSYRRADLSVSEMADFKIDPKLGDRIVAMGQAQKQQKFTKDLIADLFNNAQRRGYEGRLDDQVARLYRAVEMLIQWELQEKYGLSTGDLDSKALEGLSDDLRQRLEQRRSTWNGKIMLGLQDAYTLAEAHGSQLGAAFKRNDSINAALGYRNKSILAHGTRPIEQKNAENLDTEARGLAKVSLPDLAERCSMLQFPWIVKD